MSALSLVVLRALLQVFVVRTLIFGIVLLTLQLLCRGGNVVGHQWSRGRYNLREARNGIVAAVLLNFSAVLFESAAAF